MIQAPSECGIYDRNLYSVENRWPPIFEFFNRIDPHQPDRLVLIGGDETLLEKFSSSSRLHAQATNVDAESNLNASMF